MNIDSLEIYKKIDHILLFSDKPSSDINEIREQFKELPNPLNFIDELEKIEQELKYHPEGNVFNHTMQVLDLAAQKKDKSEDKRAFMWAALLHDIGKIRATKMRKGKITAYNHDKIGEEMAEKFLEFFNEDKNFINKVKAIIRWHMQPLFIIKDLPFKDIENMKKDVDPKEIYLISLCDRMGRGPLTEEQKYEIKNQLKRFLYLCTNNNL